MNYIAHLSKDKKLKKLFERQEPMELKKREQVHLYLCGAIMSQQLSTKVADIIHKRFLQLYDNRDPSASQILETPFQSLRGIGMSGAKANYVLNVARFAVDQGLEYKQLCEMENEAVIAYITQIKGVGRWTAEMLLMFALGREDVFSVDDLGIRQAMQKIYRLNDADKKAFREALLKISARWSPYRTYACLHLWRWKDKPAAK